jgi:RHS repeat-associated protein
MHAVSAANALLTQSAGISGIGFGTVTYKYVAPDVAPAVSTYWYCPNSNGGGCSVTNDGTTQAQALQAAEHVYNFVGYPCFIVGQTLYQDWSTPSGGYGPGISGLANVSSQQAYTAIWNYSTCVAGPSYLYIQRYYSAQCPTGYYLLYSITHCTDPNSDQITHLLFECPSNGSPSTNVGDPCDVLSGDFSQTESDYSSAGLSFERYYHSATLESNHTLGVGWTHNFAAYLVLVGNTPVGLSRPNGSQDALTSTSTAGVYISASGAAIHVQQNGSQWIASLKNGSSEVYGSTGQLVQKVAANGQVTTLAYNSIGQLATVTGPFGHSLQFAYNANGQLQQLTDPARNAIVYAYDANNNLTSATYQDLSVRQYLYENSALPNNMTGLLDENNTRFLTVSYDPTTGAVVSSQQAGGAQAVSITYSANGAVSTNALGEVDTYTFTNDPNYAPRVTSLSRNNLQQTFTVPPGATDPQRRVTQSVDASGNIIKYSYDTDHLTSKTEAFGTANSRTTSYQYLATTTALPTLVTEALRQTSYVYYPGTNNVNTKTVTDTTVTPNVSRTWTYAYNSNGQVLTLDGPRTDAADITTYTYYTCTTGAQCGQLNTVTSAAAANTPSGLVSTYNTYNAHGQPLTMTDPNGTVTTLTYDARQRLTSRQVASELTTFAYYPTGMLRQVTLPDGSYGKYTYDNAHRLTDITDGANNHIHYALDALGNRTSESAYDPTNTLSRTHTRVFNTLSQLSQDIGAANTPVVTTTLGYDNNGNAATINAPLGRNTTNAYDALNRLQQITDPASGVTQFSYDANNRVTQVTDPRSLLTTYQNDGFGGVKTLTSPDTAVTTNTYDSGGNLQTVTDARNAIATYSYDALNRVTQATYQVGGTTDQTITYTYDTGTNGKGKLIGASDAHHSLSWSYDALGRVSGKSQTIDQPGSYPVALGVSYGYTNGDLLSLGLPWFGSITYGYNSNHQITSVAVAGVSVLSNVLYEPFGTVRGWTWANGTTEVRLHNTDGNPSLLTGIESVSISYDNAYRISSVTNSSNSTLSWNYGYDSMDRLTSASKSGTSLGWTYDANGNRLQQTGAPAASALPNAGLSFTYNGRNRMATATAAGTTTNYIYNALGQLIYKNVGGTITLFMYDEAGHLLGEYTSGGQPVQEIVWLGDIPIATLRSNGSSTAVIYYVHADQLGAPRMITRPSDNTIMWRWDTDPFGTTAPNQNPQGQGTFVDNQRFPGQTALPEIGLNDNHFRAYDPVLGRFRQSDRIGLRGGINTFAYVGSSPLMRIDPLGLCEEELPDFVGDEARGQAILGKWALNHPGWYLAGTAASLFAPAALPAMAAEGSTFAFAQTTASPFFSAEGTFAGQSIADVAGALRAGILTTADVPVQFVTMDGTNLLVNTRSSLALMQAGISTSEWALVDMTGDAATEALINQRLISNGLSTTGTSVLRITGMGPGASTLIPGH